ncbi:MAG TPA: hypothetical protein VNN08_00480 [Thermoanaerobaculia bacterium]|nr:hypothetical protein [Thermoanaerobaculia bacterium]
MSSFDGLFMRDTLQDTGVVPSPGYPYYSPDLIPFRDLVGDPKTIFKNNYSEDVAKPVERGSGANPIYVRAKNSSSTVKSGWRITVYRASQSLFLESSTWRTNKLLTTTGADHAALDDVQPGSIVVGNANFLLDATSSNLFCLIGIASAGAPVVPDRFTTYDAFVTWVREMRNVCARNLTLVRNYTKLDYEALYDVVNPSGNLEKLAFEIKVSGNLPPETKFGITCPQHIKETWTLSGGGTRWAGATFPGKYKASATVWATLPAGGRWPPGSCIDCKMYVGRETTSPTARYATPWETLGISPASISGDAGITTDGRLVLIGNCNATFVKS